MHIPKIFFICQDTNCEHLMKTFSFHFKAKLEPSDSI